MRRTMRLLSAILALVAPACGDDDGSGADGHIASDATLDGQVADGGPCPRQGVLGDLCEGDCDCQADLACRGMPGEGACAVPCLAQDDCVGAPIGCDVAACEPSLGACRCPCLGDDCGDDVCVSGFCVGCAADADCADHACGPEPGLDMPRCRNDTGECVCGGACGDGTCDPAEAAAGSCPGDCALCTEPEQLVVSCSDGARVPWCDCEAGSGGDPTWGCVDPWDQCFGDTRCQREGGFCTVSEADCFSGTLSATSLGCEGASPLCCAPEPCTGAGSTYYPGSGRCCAGLRAIGSVTPMTGMVPDVTGLVCYPGCWALICAPCGDGQCQLHLGENACNCPEDCPAPPTGLVCAGSDSDSDSDCGRPFCRQEGTSCHQETPRCVGGACQREVLEHPGERCDRITDTCVVP